MSEISVLLVEDDASSRKALVDWLQKHDYVVDSADSLTAARGKLQSEIPDILIVDLQLPDGLGTELLDETRDLPLQTFLISGRGRIVDAVRALKGGALDFLEKPIDLPSLERQLRKASAAARPSGQDEERDSLGSLVGAAPSMRRVYSMIERVAPSDASVLLIGETGTGKELAAEMLHRLSGRYEQEFVAINCGALPTELAESELFGHERGSFTGANRQRKGAFERAHRGTLFLDEITEMPASQQIKLLRALETGTIQRVGAERGIRVDVRFIAATNRDPKEAIEDGRLREDLYYRLQTFPIRLPPLRERDGDVELLSQHFLQILNRESPTEKSFTEGALAVLAEHSWPGNVRELRNVLQRAHILARQEIDREHITPSARTPGDESRLEVGMSIAEAEKRLIVSTLDELDGNKKRAAEMLGISLKTLYNRLNAYADAEEQDEGEEESA